MRVLIVIDRHNTDDEHYVVATEAGLFNWAFKEMVEELNDGWFSDDPYDKWGDFEEEWDGWYGISAPKSDAQRARDIFYSGNGEDAFKFLSEMNRHNDEGNRFELYIIPDEGGKCYYSPTNPYRRG